MERVERMPLTKYSDIAKASAEEDEEALLAAASRHLQVHLLPPTSRGSTALLTKAGLVRAPVQVVLRFNVFHVTQTVSFNTIGLDTSIPARGLHGESYRGHIFWDEVQSWRVVQLLSKITQRVCVCTRVLVHSCSCSRPSTCACPK
jgi:hypothetical protein